MGKKFKFGAPVDPENKGYARGPFPMHEGTASHTSAVKQMSTQDIMGGLSLDPIASRQSSIQTPTIETLTDIEESTQTEEDIKKIAKKDVKESGDDKPKIETPTDRGEGMEKMPRIGDDTAAIPEPGELEKATMPEQGKKSLMQRILTIEIINIKEEQY